MKPAMQARLWEDPGAELPSISELDRRTLPRVVAGFLKRGAWNKADVVLAVTREGRFAVKDYAAKSWWVRTTGSMQLAREARAYEALDGLGGVPRLRRRIDRDAIAVEFVEAVRLPKFHKIRPVPGLVAKLEALLDEVHRRGVVHNDVRSRDNLLVTPAGHVYLIDFSGASCFRGSGLRRRLLMPVLEGSERRALLKWKDALAPETMTDRDRAIHRRFSRLRKLWPFNPKEDLEVKRARAAGERAR